MLGIAVLDQRHDAQRLYIMIEATPWPHFVRKHPLPCMPERGMPQIVRQRHGLCQILVKPQRPRDRACDLAYFQRMGQPRAIMLPLVMKKHLRLVLQAAKRGRMDDPVAVPLKFIARRARRRPMHPPA